MTNNKVKNYSELLESLRGANLYVDNLDELFKKHPAEWNSYNHAQIATQIGLGFHDMNTLPQDTTPAELLSRYIDYASLDSTGMSHIFEALEGNWNNVPSDVQSRIEEISYHFVFMLLDQSVSDKSLMKNMMRSNPDMLKRIVNRIPKRLFISHRTWIMRRGGLAFVTLPGISCADCPELFDYLLRVRGFKPELKSLVLIDDVFDYRNNENPRAKSHRGRVSCIVCNDREDYILEQFRCRLDKIPTVSKKGHRTPDWTLSLASGEIVGTVECYSGDPENIRDRVRKTIAHADDKETGSIYYSDQYSLPDDRIRIAAHVHGIPAFAPIDPEKLRREVLEAIPEGTMMDGLLYVMADEINHHTISYYFDFGGNDASDLLAEDVIIFDAANALKKPVH